MITRIGEDIKAAMLAKEKERLLVLRSLKTDLMNRKIELMRDLSEEEALEVVRRAVKSREQASELFAQGGRQDLVAHASAEIAILRTYLPQALGEDELRGIVSAAVLETGATGTKDMGAVMKLVLERTGGRADGKTVSAMVRAALG